MASLDEVPSGLTTIRRQVFVYFCLHRKKCSLKGGGMAISILEQNSLPKIPKKLHLTQNRQACLNFTSPPSKIEFDEKPVAITSGCFAYRASSLRCSKSGVHKNGQRRCREMLLHGSE